MLFCLLKISLSVSNDEQNKFFITIFDFLHKNTDFSISNMSLKLEKGRNNFLL